MGAADLSNTQQVTQGLLEAAQQRPRLRVVPWREFLLRGSATSFLQEDGVHPNEAGIRVLSDLFVRACAQY